MGVHVRDIARHEVRRSERNANQLLERVAFGVESGDVTSVAKNAAAEHFGIDQGAALLRMLEPLEHEHTSAFAHDETGAINIKWAASLARIDVVGQHAHIVKTSSKQR